MRLPEGIQREFDAAVQRTGWTYELRRAQTILPLLLKSEPHVVEWIFNRASEPYDPKMQYEEFDVTETFC